MYVYNIAQRTVVRIKYYGILKVALEQYRTNIQLLANLKLKQNAIKHECEHNLDLGGCFNNNLPHSTQAQCSVEDHTEEYVAEGQTFQMPESGANSRLNPF